MHEENMFEVNEYIFHGGSGVCLVKDICRVNMNRADPQRLYYQLVPLYDSNSVIYTPTDSPKTKVRKILSRRQVEEMIKEFPLLETIWIDNEKTREEQYRAALRTNDCYEWMRMIKTLYLRGQARQLEGKRLTQTDERYLQTAENLLYGELAVSLGLEKEEVRDYIAQQVMRLEEQEGKCS